MADVWVWIYKASIDDYAYVTKRAYDETWQAQGWILQRPPDLLPPGVVGVAAVVVSPGRVPVGVENAFTVTPTAGWGDGTEAYGSEQAFVVFSDSDAPPDANTTVGRTITATTNATPVAVTVASAHTLTTGDTVRITGTGIGALDNKWWEIVVTGSTTFTLTGSVAPGSTASTGYAFTNRSPVLMRIDGVGGIGCGGFHVAPGLRGKSNQTIAAPGTGSGAVWINPFGDWPGLVINNPNTTAWPTTPVSSYLICGDTRTTTNVFEIISTGKAVARRGLQIAVDGATNSLSFGVSGDVELHRTAAGTIGSNATLQANDGLATQTYIGNFFTIPAIVFGTALDTALGRIGAGIVNVVNLFEMPEVTAPANAPANKARLFVRDNGAGKTQLAVIFPTGAVQVLATEP